MEHCRHESDGFTTVACPRCRATRPATVGLSFADSTELVGVFIDWAPSESAEESVAFYNQIISRLDSALGPKFVMVHDGRPHRGPVSGLPASGPINQYLATWTPRLARDAWRAVSLKPDGSISAQFDVGSYALTWARHFDLMQWVLKLPVGTEFPDQNAYVETSGCPPLPSLSLLDDRRVKAGDSPSGEILWVNLHYEVVGSDPLQDLTLRGRAESVVAK